MQEFFSDIDMVKNHINGKLLMLSSLSSIIL